MFLYSFISTAGSMTNIIIYELILKPSSMRLLSSESELIITGIPKRTKIYSEYLFCTIVMYLFFSKKLNKKKVIFIKEE